MPTIAEVRQKYPQYQDMSDADLAGALHRKYYSDMPVEQFNAKIGLPPVSDSPATPAAPAAGDQGYQRSTILPLGFDKATGDISLAVPGLIKGLFDSGVQAVTAPGRAMNGELQVMDANGTTPQAIGEALNFAGWAAGASPAASAATKVAPAIAPPPVALGPGQEAALAASRLGVELPRAAVSDKIAVQQMGKALTNVPIGGTPLRKASETAIKQLDEAAMRVQQGYGTGDIAKAGSMVRQGVQDYSSNTLDDLVSKKYGVVDSLVNQNAKAPLKATANRVNSILASRQAAALPSEGSAASIVKQAIDRPEGLNYEGVKRLRTEVGQMLKNPQMAPAGTSQDELRGLYGSLSEDLKSVVQVAGGDKAVKAFEAANSFAAKTIEEQKALDKIIGPKSDEGLFSSIQAMAGSNSRANLQSLMKVRKAVSPETWDEISSSVISTMGRAPDGSFSPDRFVTAYGKLSGNGKALLFRGGSKKDLAASLDDIATVSQRFKQLNQYANPSGTGQAIVGGSYIPALFVEPTTLISSVASTRVLSRILAKPTSAKKMAEWSKAYEKAAFEPTPANQNMLGVRAKVLALAVANDAGDPGLFNQLTPAISRVGQSPASPENNQPRAEENQQAGPQGQHRMLLPNEL